MKATLWRQLDRRRSDWIPKDLAHKRGQIMPINRAFGTQLESAVQEPVFGKRDCRNFGNITVIDAAEFRLADQGSP